MQVTDKENLHPKIKDNVINKERIIRFLKEKYQFHSAILYGSRAGNDFRSNSDYDILCVKNGGERIREIIEFENLVIDLIIEDENMLVTPQPLVYLWQAKIMVDDKGFAKALVDTTLKKLAEPPPLLSEARIVQRKKQISDILFYVQQNNALGDYRKHDLFPKLLNFYHAIRNIWDLGDKYAFERMEINDPESFYFFRRAMASDALFSEIEALVDHINKKH
jgi:predicted nucleotidyltransferase